MLSLPVIPDCPDVVGSNGSHRKKVFINVACIRNEIPAGSVPVICQRIIPVAVKIRGLGITHCPDVAGRGARDPLEDLVGVARGWGKGDVAPAGPIPVQDALLADSPDVVRGDGCNPVERPAAGVGDDGPGFAVPMQRECAAFLAGRSRLVPADRSNIVCSNAIHRIQDIAVVRTRAWAGNNAPAGTIPVLGQSL